jgi:ammonium transporter, Amt family
MLWPHFCSESTNGATLVSDSFRRIFLENSFVLARTISRARLHDAMLAPAGTLVAWTILDAARQQKATAVGPATAIVVGLVAVTPAAGFIGPMSAIALGAIAAIPSYIGLIWWARTNLDDSLDVVAAHGLGGTVGALLTGVFAQKSLNGVADGLLFGNPGQFVTQAVAVGAAIIYSGALTFVLLKVVALVFPLRASEAGEQVGIDLVAHGEEAYVHASGTGV